MNYIKYIHFVKNLISISKNAVKIVRYNHYITKSIISYGEDVILAKKKGLPIVALESTIITHGMPYPHNFITALEVEDIIRRKVG
jgi:pseudouridine-5'-phosphate glycosidase